MTDSSAALPLGLSVPHAGLEVPDRMRGLCVLSAEEIAHDGDEGAAEIYLPLRERVAHLVTTDVARAILDMNRAVDDFRKDGVVKTHTCWDLPVYRQPPSRADVEWLLREYHAPYHAALSGFADGSVVLGVDCHTMAAKGPPVGPDPGRERPLVCLGDGAGQACPAAYVEAMRQCFAERFGADRVTVNEPFSGGYITRTHGREMPWIQVELSRGGPFGAEEKREMVLGSLQAWCALAPWRG